MSLQRGTIFLTYIVTSATLVVTSALLVVTNKLLELSLKYIVDLFCRSSQQFSLHQCPSCHELH